MNYAKSLPRDVGGAAMQEFQVPASMLANHTRDNATASSVITLTPDTTLLEIASNGGGGAMRWVGVGETTASVVSQANGANFNHAIGADTVRRFVVPKESSGGGLGASSIIGVNRDYGLYQRVAVKSLGVSSILVTEY